MTFEQYKFWGRAQSLAEDELRASLTDDKEGLIVKELWEAYLADGKPKNVNKWLIPRLKALFQYVSRPPEWVEDAPTWPFFNGRPMIFIDQIGPTDGRVTEELLSADNVIYVFGVREKVDEKGGWRMIYKVIYQNKTIRNIVAIPPRNSEYSE